MSEFDYVKKKRDDVDVIPANIVPFVRKVMKLYTRLNVWVFKKSNGKWMTKFPGGYPICMVGMTGRKSGQRREVALIHLPHGDNKLLVASQGGLDIDPVWYKNIMANPQVDIMVGGITKKYAVRQASADEKRALWPHLLSLYPGFDEYQARTDRDIPVLICEPVSG
jgi:deazaflavin-dependent oxidoreductase (nitroreductase family)